MNFNTMIIYTDKFSPVPILQNVDIMDLTIIQASERAMFISLQELNDFIDLDAYQWDKWEIKLYQDLGENNDQ